MRAHRTHKGLRVQAIAGTHVVLLGLNMKQQACNGLRGFAFHRTDHTEEEAYWLAGVKTFEQTDPGTPPGTKHSTRQHPIQDFTWADYSAKPGHDYTYRVLALKGPLTDLQPSAEVSVRVHTESPEQGDHDVYFNRGAGASQEFTRRFGNRKPGAVGGASDPAWAWLSRGAHEAILEFIARAKGHGFGLRVCAYEFQLPSVLAALRAAKKRGAFVQALFDATEDPPRNRNRKAVKDAGISGLCDERATNTPKALSHNKFIVLMKGKRALAVLTGSTNFTDGGVFGQSNVVHVIEDPEIAASYLAYFERLAQNPSGQDLRPELSASHPLPAGKPPKGTSLVFSPRDAPASPAALLYYAKLAGNAKDALFMTFAFGMHPSFVDVYRNGEARLRYALMETLLGPGVKASERATAEQAMTNLRRRRGNRFAVGGRINLNRFDRWLGERLTGLNTHVKYIHTKYMLIDPLGRDPIVITGSANFSKASTTDNDENMVLIRGNKRVADIYLGEFVRLWQHNAFREWASGHHSESTQAGTAHLDPTDSWWNRFFGDGALSREREYFSG